MDKQPGSEFFKNVTVDINGTSAASNLNTDAIDMSDYNGPWVVMVSRTLTDGSPVFTIQHSIAATGADWHTFDEEAENAPVPDNFMKSSFYPAFMRLAYTANGATGNMTMILQRTNVNR